MTLRRLLHRVLALGRRNRLERELAGRDRRAPRDGRARRGRARAVTHGGAHEARRQFGGVDQVQELHRDARSVRWLDHAARDARYAVIALGRERTFAALAIGVLALGIGATTAMFSLVDGVLFKPLPFPSPERIVRVWETPTPATANSTTTRTFVELVRQTRVFEALSAESQLHGHCRRAGRAGAPHRPLRLGGPLQRVRRAAGAGPRLPSRRRPAGHTTAC